MPLGRVPVSVRRGVVVVTAPPGANIRVRLEADEFSAAEVDLAMDHAKAKILAMTERNPVPPGVAISGEDVEPAPRQGRVHIHAEEGRVARARLDAPELTPEELNFAIDLVKYHMVLDSERKPAPPAVDADALVGSPADDETLAYARAMRESMESGQLARVGGKGRRVA